MNLPSLVGKAHGLLARIGGSLQSVLLLIVRLYWGWQFHVTGTGKLHHLDRTAKFFASLDIPGPKWTAILVSGTECVGGLLLLAGLGSRFVALVLMGEMFTAYATADQKALLGIFSDPDKFVTADPFLFLFAATLVFVFGPGRISLDALIERKTGSGQ